MPSKSGLEGGHRPDSMQVCQLILPGPLRPPRVSEISQDILSADGEQEERNR